MLSSSSGVGYCEGNGSFAERKGGRSSSGSWRRHRALGPPLAPPRRGVQNLPEMAPTMELVQGLSRGPVLELATSSKNLFLYSPTLNVENKTTLPQACRL